MDCSAVGKTNRGMSSKHPLSISCCPSAGTSSHLTAPTPHACIAQALHTCSHTQHNHNTLCRHHCQLCLHTVSLIIHTLPAVLPTNKEPTQLHSAGLKPTPGFSAQPCSPHRTQQVYVALHAPKKARTGGKLRQCVLQRCPYSPCEYQPTSGAQHSTAHRAVMPA